MANSKPTIHLSELICNGYFTGYNINVNFNLAHFSRSIFLNVDEMVVRNRIFKRMGK